MHPTPQRLWQAVVVSVGLLAFCSGCSTPSDAADGNISSGQSPSTTPATGPSSETTTGSGSDGEVSSPSTSGPIDVTESGTLIENMHFVGSGDEDCVTIKGASDVTVRNSRFTNCHKGVYAVSSSNVVVVDNVFEADMAGRGRNAVQFNRVSGGHVARNTSTVSNGATLSEDHINIYMSNGTASDPIVIEANELTGGGPSESGSGIVLGDGGGSWQIARNNNLTDPGQVGIGAVGGSHLTIEDNTLSSTSHPWSNVGMVAWDWDGSGCSDVTISRNEVAQWVNSSGQSNIFWENGSCSNLSVTDNSWQTGTEPEAITSMPEWV